MTQNHQDTLALSTFIKVTLVEIIKRIEQARVTIKEMETNAGICLTGLHFGKEHSPAIFNPGRGFVQEIEFDLAITVTKEQSCEGTGLVGLNLGVSTIEWLPSIKAEGDMEVRRQSERS